MNASETKGTKISELWDVSKLYGRMVKITGIERYDEKDSADLHLIGMTGEFCPKNVNLGGVIISVRPNGRRNELVSLFPSDSVRFLD